YADLDLLRTKREIENIKARPAPPPFDRPDPEDIDELAMALANAKSNITFLHESRAQLMMEGKCPTCGTELNADHRQKELDRVNQELEKTEQEKLACIAQHAALTKRRDVWAAQDTWGPDCSAELPELEESLRRYEQKIRYRALIKANEAWLTYQAN